MGFDHFCIGRVRPRVRPSASRVGVVPTRGITRGTRARRRRSKKNREGEKGANWAGKWSKEVAIMDNGLIGKWSNWIMI